jgi:NAD(P)-dependent dehydrogenase (short-subunit alcohol dehydrogenase family)
MSTSLSGRVVAVTGAVGGIGAVTCERLRSDRATVYALDVRPEDGEFGVVCDVSDPDSVEEAMRTIHSKEGRIDGIVAGAAIVEDDVPSEEMSPAEFAKVVGVNLNGVFHTLTAAGRYMLAQHSGAAVAISSMSGNHTVNTPQRQCAYNASKAGVSALVRSLAAEWAGRGVRVNAIAPGYIDTQLLALKKHQFGQWLGHTPQGRMGSPAEVAATIAFLLGDDAAYFCGSELLMDGGYTLI